MQVEKVTKHSHLSYSTRSEASISARPGCKAARISPRLQKCPPLKDVHADFGASLRRVKCALTRVLVA